MDQKQEEAQQSSSDHPIAPQPKKFKIDQRLVPTAAIVESTNELQGYSPYPLRPSCTCSQLDVIALGIKVFNQQDVEQAVSKQMDRAIIEQDRHQQLSASRRSIDVGLAESQHEH
jgi:hypothetical protein